MPGEPRIFIGSASESKHVAAILQGLLGEDGARVTLWADAFLVGGLYREQLATRAQETDYAVFVFSADDQSVSRGVTQDAPRDNVLYEMGLFGGTLGVDHVFVVQAAGNIKVPSDLLGVHSAIYQPPPPATARRDPAWTDAVRPAALAVLTAIDARERTKINRRDDAAVASEEPRPPKQAPPVLPSTSEMEPLQLLEMQLLASAVQTRLRPLTTSALGALVVHPISGVGRIVGDLPEGGDTLLTVRFRGGMGHVRRGELFAVPIDARQPRGGDANPPNAAEGTSARVP